MHKMGVVSARLLLISFDAKDEENNNREILLQSMRKYESPADTRRESKRYSNENKFLV